MKRVAWILALIGAVEGLGCASTPSGAPSGAAPSTTTLPSGGKRASDGGGSYLALGDSFTIGTGSSPSQSFAARLRDHWSACPVRFENVARNGYTSGDLIERELPVLGTFHPSFVTIAIGANDIVQGIPEETYRANLRTIFASVLAEGVAADRVVVLPQPDWSLSPTAESFGEPGEIRQKIDRANAILKTEAESSHLRFIDLFPLLHELAEKKQLASDGLHPSASAHQAWADALDQTLGECPARTGR